MKKLSVFFCCISFFSISNILAQTDLCDDGGFEAKDFLNWTWNFKTYSRDHSSILHGIGISPEIVNVGISQVNAGADIPTTIKSVSKMSWSWQLTDSTSRTNPRLSFNPKYNRHFGPSSLYPNRFVLKQVYSGKSALKIGSERSWAGCNPAHNSSGGGGISAVSKKVIVNYENNLLTFKYALVFIDDKDAGQGAVGPFFGVRVFSKKTNGPTFRSFSNFYYSTPFIMTWPSQNKWSFHQGTECSLIREWTLPTIPKAKDWECGMVDLSEFIGDTIDIEFLVSGSNDHNYYAIAYLDEICFTNGCTNLPEVRISNVSKKCGADAQITGTFQKPLISSTTYASLLSNGLKLSIRQGGSEILRLTIPSSSIRDFTGFGTFSLSSSFLYDALYNIVSSNGAGCYDLVAIAEFSNGLIKSSSSQGFLNGQDNDWCYCCDYNTALINKSSTFDAESVNNCVMKITMSKDTLKFQPPNRYNYFLSNSKIFENLLSGGPLMGNFDPSIYTDGFFDYPSKMDSFNFSHINYDYNCAKEATLYEIVYKHPICPYYTKLKIESTCKVPLSCENVTCQKKDSITLNPYLNNLMGNWRPSETYVYNVKRQDEPKNVRTGEYLMNSYVPAYVMGANQWQLNTFNNNSLIKKDKVLNYDLSGNMVENKNPLNIYSAKKYAYNNTHPHLVAYNSTFQESVYYSFESLDHNKGKLEFKIPHNVVSDPFYEKMNKANAQVSSEASHTGNLSYKVIQHAGVQASDTPYVSTLAYFCGSPPDDASPNYKINLNTMQVRANDNTFKPVFDLVPGKEYILTYWVKNIDKEDYGLGYIDTSFDCHRLKKRVLSSTNAGNIEGWYKISKNFTVPAGAKLLKLVFYPGMSGSYFDDIRILPTEANMKSYVYDVKNRMTAELDENNYATFFDYDDQGNLIRVRKETEKGIITVNESRIYLKDQ